MLLHALPDDGLEAGDVGTVVHLYGDGTGVEVEFLTGDGATVAVITLSLDEVRALGHGDVLHVRPLAA